ncbi:MAG: hypothetical protein QM726_23960 [Chitinophagaceae bacterium]
MHQYSFVLPFFRRIVLLTVVFSLHLGLLAQSSPFEKASANGAIAAIGFERCDRYANDWLSYADPETKLLPRNLYHEVGLWNANDCAADNFPFMVLTSFFTNQQNYNGVMRQILTNERKLTARVRSLPDDYSFTKRAFVYDKADMGRVVFGTAEYCKDGLMPITEWLGKTPWSERMLELLNDLNNEIDVADAKKLHYSETLNTEINGELIQVLSRVYWMTGDKKFLDWALQIGDHFLLGEDYPLKSMTNLRLRDHGCELLSGLCELYATLHYVDKNKKELYRKPLYDLLDYVLQYGRNEDGLFYNAINPQTNQVLDKGLADCWGYNLNGYYTVYMIDSTARYKDAVVKVLNNINKEKYHSYNWENGSQDGYADAIESAINLYNRVPIPAAAEWIDSQIKVMWSLQDSVISRFPIDSNVRKDWLQPGTGVIEGWYGDGNFARTSIMYNLWKSKGTYLQPWKPDVELGAEMKGDSLFVSLTSSSSDWSGKLYFDKVRHKAIMKMPIDWPRINQFPEWYTIDPKRKYKLLNEKGKLLRNVTGSDLLNGIEANTQKGSFNRMILVGL